MVLNKIPSFQEVKDWVNANTATSVNGETGDVIISQPITSKDRAETFEESGVTVTTSYTNVFNGSIELTETINNYTQSMAGGPLQSSVFDGNWFGVTIIPQVDLKRISLTVNATSYGGTNAAEVNNVTTGELIYSDTVNYGNDDVLTVEPTGGFKAGEEYVFALNAIEGGGYYFFNTTNGPISVDNEFIDLNTGPYSDGTSTGTSNRVSVFNDIEVEYVGKSGSATIEWPNPNDIYAWDMATYQASPDGEMVEVFVEESTDGGSTWTEIQGPISRGDLITADPGSRVRFRVELSRSDPSNNPTLDSIHRRYVV